MRFGQLSGVPGNLNAHDRLSADIDLAGTAYGAS